MAQMTCTNCGGDGLYKNPTSHGPYCFACKGTGKVTPRKPRAAKVITLSPTIKIADRCAGRPMRDFAPATLAYLNLTSEAANALADLWDAGVREVARGAY